MEYIETETLDDRHRLALSHFDMPLEWLEDVDALGVYVTGPRDSKHLHRGDATAALEDIEHHAADSESALVAMAKHLSRNGYAYRVINTRGYSQGEWLDGIAYLDVNATGIPWDYAHATLDAALDQWTAWLWGDTYLLDIEHRVTYTAPGYDDIDRWLTVYEEDTSRVIATRKHYGAGYALRDIATHYGLDVSAYATRESETV
jgi:hypothetical protein